MRNIFRSRKPPKYLVITEATDDGINWTPTGTGNRFSYLPVITPDHAAEAWFVYAAHWLKYARTAHTTRLAVYKTTRAGDQLVHVEQIPPEGYYTGNWADVSWPLGTYP